MRGAAGWDASCHRRAQDRCRSSPDRGRPWATGRSRSYPGRILASQLLCLDPCASQGIFTKSTPTHHIFPASLSPACKDPRSEWVSCREGENDNCVDTRCVQGTVKMPGRGQGHLRSLKGQRSSCAWWARAPSPSL